MRVRWTQPAIADLTGIFEYLSENRSPDVAKRVIGALFEAAESSFMPVHP